MASASQLPLAVHTAGPVTVVRFTQRKLDHPHIEAIGEELSGLAARPGLAELHLDFDGVGYLSSAGLAKVVSLHHRVRKAGGRVILFNLNPFLADLFRVTRLENLLDIRR